MSAGDRQAVTEGGTEVTARQVVRAGRMPGLDGIRALAIIAVLVFHMFPGLLPGGFVGVDLFFVLSGFLITTLLLREIAKRGRIDLPAFWKRRARRLLPALFLVVIVSVPIAAIVERDLMVNIGRQVLGALTFTSNWLEIAAGSSYADQTAPQLFVNFWSLAVEEQFYLLWPLIAIVVIRLLRAPRALAALTMAIALVSAVLMAVLVDPGADPTRVYYGTDTHLFGLMFGICLAFLAQDSRGVLTTSGWRAARSVVPVVGLVGLFAVARFVPFESVWTFRGGLFAASLAGTFLIASLLGSPTWFTKVMELGPMKWVGERSYGIYLWHWPAIVILDALVPTAPETGARVAIRFAAVVVTLGVSAASYAWLEEPVRRLGFRGALAALGGAIRGFRPSAALPARLATVLAVVLVGGTSVAVATAPEMTETAAQIAENERQLAEQREQQLQDARENGGETGSDGPGDQGAQPGGEETTTDGADGDTGEDPTSGDGPTSEADFSPPTGDELTIFGDSLVVTSMDALEYYYPGVMISALSNDQWPAGEAAVEAALSAGAVRRAVVLHYGTNGGVPDPSIPERILDALGPDRAVVVVNLYGQSSWVPAANDELAQIVEGRDNVIIADWNATASENPGALQADNVHPDIDGAHEYTHTITRAFEQLAERYGQYDGTNGEAVG
ncbi:Lipopolysaccharide modification acyltransferase [Actinomycetales bacterium JB111]|nr:Lipopolysaccharide modification acyltransferase [Actinomycetales bacterium JB111]